MIRIISIDEEPVHVVPVRYPKEGGGVGYGDNPIHLAFADGLPPELNGLIAVADLQGVEISDEEDQIARLIGHTIAEELFLVMSRSDNLPRPAATGVILAGDLHIGTDLSARGGTGDDRAIWRAFNAHFRWVAGVAGNHDTFGENVEDQVAFRASEGTYLLDGSTAEVDSLVIGGVSGIIGNPRKASSRCEERYLALVKSTARMKPDILILHESPEVAEAGYNGSAIVRQCLDRLPPTLVICGHCRWKHPGLWQTNSGTQILNVDGRVVILRR